MGLRGGVKGGAHAATRRWPGARTCMSSGAKYCGVPAVPYLVVTRPKSQSFTAHLASMSRLCDFRSRCTMGGDRECRKAMPRATSVCKG